MRYYVYVLLSLKDGNFYIGRTNDLRRRLSEHFHGSARSTKHRLPLKLIYHETYHTWTDATRREKYLKGGNGRAALRIQLQDALQEP